MLHITILGSGTSTGVPLIGCNCEVCLSKDPRDARLRTSIKIQSENKVTSSSPESLIALPIGTQVEHQRFGKGVVTEVDGVGNDKKATINFKGSGEKKLLLRFAKLKIIE